MVDFSLMFLECANVTPAWVIAVAIILALLILGLIILAVIKLLLMLLVSTSIKVTAR